MNAYRKILLRFEQSIKLLYAVTIKPLIKIAENIHYPGEEKLSLAHVSRFFFTGIRKGDIQMRASAISFDFFLAIFPAIIFFFTLIPYVPIKGFQDQILTNIQEIMPPHTFDTARTTIEDIINQPHGGLLSFGFLFALIVATNGVRSMIDGFNKSYHGVAVRSGLKQWIASLSLTVLVAFILIFSIAIILLTSVASDYLHSKDLLNTATQLFFLQTITWVILLAAALTTISCLYYYGPSKKNRRPFISVGSVTATALLALTSFGFNFFVNHISQHNKIYGSIGTLIVILIWINFNTLQLIIGFELNASIENALRSSEAASKDDSKESDEGIQRSL